MIQFAEFMFWASVCLVLYCYFVFPAIIVARGVLFPRPCKGDDIEPSVSLLIAAHNEADSIGEKLANALKIDYPKDRLEIIIASDGSTDDTENIVGRFASQGVRLLSLPRQGKAAALNAAVAEASGEILVFSDATSIFSKDALRNLVRPFSDPNVGGAAGNLVYRKKQDTSLVEDGEQFHSGLDRRLKSSAALAGNAISASGALYAIRATLFRAVPEGVTDDFIVSTRVIAQGYRLVFVPDAISYDPAAKSNADEFRRKVRVITRGFRSVITMRELLNPFRFGFYSVQLFSQKVLRRLLVFPFLLLLLLAPLLWSQGVVYQMATAAQVIVYGLALGGLLLHDNRLGKLKLFRIPFYFCLVNAAALVAAGNVVRGRRIVLWEPQRPDEPTGSNMPLGAEFSGRRTI